MDLSHDLRRAGDVSPPILAGRRITVMGLGQFGGGVGAVRFLLDRGARVTVTDLRTEQQLAESLAQIDTARLDRLILGEHQPEDFNRADLVVVNPAVKQPGNRFVSLARDAGVPLTSEMNLFWPRCRGRKIVVTGTVGKSTTATLIHSCLKAAGIKTRLGGNIGVSLLPEVDEIAEDEWVVLELSSFQLADLDRLQPRPDVAVVTNFFPNHLDWHETLDEYRYAKQTALRWQSTQNVAVLNADDPDVRAWPTAGRTVWFGRNAPDDSPGVRVQDDRLIDRSDRGEKSIRIEQLSPGLRWPHTRTNVAAALAAVSACSSRTAEDFAAALGNFQTLPHRLERVCEIQGRTFINDSKATTPEAAIAALESFQRPIVLIAGGKDKGVDLSAFAAEIAHRTKGVALLGETSSRLSTEIQSNGLRAVYEARSLVDAVYWTWKQSSSGDVILLSPGCASDGEFLNYEQRGERFVEVLRSIVDS